MKAWVMSVAVKIKTTLQPKDLRQALLKNQYRESLNLDLGRANILVEVALTR